MDIIEPTEIAVGGEEIIISDGLDPCQEVIVEDCSVQSEEIVETYIPLEDVQETVEIETPIEIAEAIIKTEVIEDDELIIPAEECEVEIDTDINEFECIYIKDNYLENMVHRAEAENSETSSDENSLSCQVCNKVFMNRGVLNAHMLRHANGKFFCGVCDKAFKKKHNLDFHMNLHLHSGGGNTIYNCTFCSQTFSLREELTAHMVVHNVPVHSERVVCNICHKNFQKSYLKIHMSSHFASNDYTCTFCAKNLSSKQSLYMHMNTVHANEGCYECTYCEKRFFWKSYLDRHITVHTKEKSHHCTYCTKAFTRKLALRKHLATHVVKVFAGSVKIES